MELGCKMTYVVVVPSGLVIATHGDNYASFFFRQPFALEEPVYGRQDQPLLDHQRKTQELTYVLARYPPLVVGQGQKDLYFQQR